MGVCGAAPVRPYFSSSGLGRFLSVDVCLRWVVGVLCVQKGKCGRRILGCGYSRGIADAGCHTSGLHKSLRRQLDASHPACDRWDGVLLESWERLAGRGLLGRCNDEAAIGTSAGGTIVVAAQVEGLHCGGVHVRFRIHSGNGSYGEISCGTGARSAVGNRVRLLRLRDCALSDFPLLASGSRWWGGFVNRPYSLCYDDKACSYAVGLDIPCLAGSCLFCLLDVLATVFAGIWLAATRLLRVGIFETSPIPVPAGSVPGPAAFRFADLPLPLRCRDNLWDSRTWMVSAF